MIPMQINVLQIVATAVISAVVTGMLTYIGVIKQSIKALKGGLLSLLRAEIIRSHDKYTQKGLCPLYAKEALEKAYNAYSALGGNGAMKQVYEETMALPID